ncbi:MAG: hypothetical protein KUL88_06935 [Rhizobium sp.]|nr:hypothetical protein [Rhizobium sp.]
MATLRLYIDEDWPEGGGICDWALVDAGRSVSRGRSSPEFWPRVDSRGSPLAAMELALDPTLYSLHDVLLPQGARQGFARLAGAALEDKLLDAPERYHFVRLSPEKAAHATILAMPSSRLGEILASLRGLEGLPPITRAVAVSSLLPPPGDAWWLWPAPSGRLLVHGRIGPAGAVGTMSLDHGADVSRLLAASAGNPPGRLCLLGVFGEPVGASIPVESKAAFDWAAGDWYAAANMLIDAFRPTGSGSVMRGLKRAALFASLLLAVYGIVLLAEWRALAAREKSLQAELRQLATKVLPGQPLILPLAQLATEADRGAHRRGQAGQGDFLTMTNLVADLLAQAGVRELSYGPGRLEVRLDRLDAARELAVGDVLSHTGFAAKVTRDKEGTVLAIAWLAAGADQ